jgi:hypothetical protein
VVYISLGAGQQITPGMTFEVYDKMTGIPKAANSMEAEQLPGHGLFCRGDYRHAAEVRIKSYEYGAAAR